MSRAAWFIKIVSIMTVEQLKVTDMFIQRDPENKKRPNYKLTPDTFATREWTTMKYERIPRKILHTKYVEDIN